MKFSKSKQGLKGLWNRRIRKSAQKGLLPSTESDSHLLIERTLRYRHLKGKERPIRQREICERDYAISDLIFKSSLDSPATIEDRSDDMFSEHLECWGKPQSNPIKYRTRKYRLTPSNKEGNSTSLQARLRRVRSRATSSFLPTDSLTEGLGGELGAESVSD
ncbi:hypothetical protein M9H77_23552 [Catharanthus roseus]|uniref:Uncharacterized protein n=1 Tax=Catharanthus roseus TaxID=4058 RepID=A0ACC0AVS6_CATRO|nr:hypothetical protein M9H77_23552 [Catharanthus roseus]